MNYISEPCGSVWSLLFKRDGKNTVMYIQIERGDSVAVVAAAQRTAASLDLIQSFSAVIKFQ